MLNEIIIITIVGILLAIVYLIRGLGQSVSQLRSEMVESMDVVGGLVELDNNMDKANELQAIFFNNTTEGIVITDGEDRVLSINPSFTKITGYPINEIHNKKISAILDSGEEMEGYEEDIIGQLEEKGEGSWIIKNRRKNGEIYSQKTYTKLITNIDGSAKNYLTILSDVTDEVREMEMDILTNAKNRAYFNTALEQLLHTSKRHNFSFGVMFIDLDHFKQINDTLGHLVGDGLLKGVADRILDVIRDSDTVSRLGGDEFCILISDVKTEDDCTMVAEKIISNITKPYDINGNEVSVTCSLGISLYPQHGGTVDELTERADEAMYEAKNGGRNGYSLYKK